MAAIPYKKCSMSDDPWNGAAQQKKLEVSRANCRAMYMWVDPDGDPEVKASYKFPFRFVNEEGAPESGSTKACSAIIAVLNGGRGGANIPDDDREGIYSVAARHLRDAGEEPPVLRSTYADEDHERELATEVAGDSNANALEDGPIVSNRGTAQLAARTGEMEGDRAFRRIQNANVRAIQIDGQPGVTLKIVRYNVVDDYGSVWMPGCVLDGLNERLPQMAWSHDRSSIIGRAVPGFVDDGDGQIVNFRFANLDRVPDANMAHSLVDDEIIDECSVGFRWEYEFHTPNDEELKRWPTALEIITKAFVSEVSLVMEGAVPGAKVLSVRESPIRVVSGENKRGVISDETAGKIVAQFAQGSISLLEALNAIQEASVDMEATSVDDQSTADDAQGIAEGDSSDPQLGCDDDDDSDDQVVTVTVEVPIGDDDDDEEDVQLDAALLAALQKVTA